MQGTSICIYDSIGKIRDTGVEENMIGNRGWPVLPTESASASSTNVGQCYHHYQHERASPRSPPGNIHTSNNHGLMPLFACIYSKCTGAQVYGYIRSWCIDNGSGSVRRPNEVLPTEQACSLSPIVASRYSGNNAHPLYLQYSARFRPVAVCRRPVLFDIISDLKDTHCPAVVRHHDW